MDLFLIVTFGFIILFEVVELCRALFTGRMGFGERALTRAGDPDRFWASAALTALSIPVFPWLLLRSIQGDPPGPGDPDFSGFLLGAMLAFLLVRFLLRGTASAAGTPFSRQEEPTQYWLIVALTVVAICLVTWTALRFPLLT
jgi:hypothetical protein